MVWSSDTIDLECGAFEVFQYGMSVCATVAKLEGVNLSSQNPRLRLNALN